MIFANKEQKGTRPKIGASTSIITPKYLKPKILAIDVAAGSVNALRGAGYNVTEGTFGAAYLIERSDGAHVVTLDTVALPNLNEQEVLLVDLDGADFGTTPQTKIPNGVDLFWQPTSEGVITPRAFAMAAYLDQFEKVFQHSGMCVVFASRRRTFPYFKAKSLNGSLYEVGGTDALDNWGFLVELARTRVTNQQGTEILFENNALAQLIRRGAAGAEYQCSFNHQVSESERWFPLAKNKYGDIVAGLYIDTRTKQYLLLLPQMPEFHKIAVELIEDFFANWHPDLFPDLEGARWVHRPEYEVPQVTAHENEIVRVQEEAQEKIQVIRLEIEALRHANADWYTLLCGTGDELVQAVIRSLKRLGFKNVVDADDEGKKTGNATSLREDIQILDRSPVLVVDVKGINGRPDDDESRQAEKHAIMRMRDWKRHDVQPLTIINHERNRPPRDRDKQAYRSEIVANAQDTHLGLMTTWDLFRLLRNAEELKWPPQTVMPIFYRFGRIEPIPEHYRSIGSIVKVWEKAFGIVPSESVSIGDRLAIENGDSFEEIPVVSLMVDDAQVQTASAESNCGVACENAKRFREGVRVCKIVQ